MGALREFITNVELTESPAMHNYEAMFAVFGGSRHMLHPTTVLNMWIVAMRRAYKNERDHEPHVDMGGES